jgi:hypothetical protein
MASQPVDVDRARRLARDAIARLSGQRVSACPLLCICLLSAPARQFVSPDGITLDDELSILHNKVRRRVRARAGQPPATPTPSCLPATCAAARRLRGGGAGVS